MACQKYANKVGMMMKVKVNVLAKPNPYIFSFTLPLDNILEDLLLNLLPSNELLVRILHTDYYDQSAVHSCSGFRLFQSHV